MQLPRLIAGLFAVASCIGTLAGQAAPTPSEAIPLTVPKGTPLQVVLDKEVRVSNTGQKVHGRIVQPVYAFDKVVIPAGTEVNGRIARLGDISGKQRTREALNADFSPARSVDIAFDELVLSSGRHIPFRSIVTPGSGNVMQLVTAEKNEQSEAKKSAASRKVEEAEEQAKGAWHGAVHEVKDPGRMHRLKRWMQSLLPVHPQYMAAGTTYFAELQDLLDFGTEPATSQKFSAMGNSPPPGSVVRALLVTPLDSAVTPKGAPVEAVLSQPLLQGDSVILPAGSRLRGTVTEVRPARHLHHNGQLRIAFRQLVPPDGLERKVAAELGGVQAGRDAHVKLDSEGGAEATSPKTRYLSTGFTVALAATAFRQHSDADDIGGTQQGGIGGGLAGFKLVGLAVTAIARYQPLGMALGAYGTARSVYSHFLSRGTEVVFPRNTALEIRFGSQDKTPLPAPPQGSTPQQPATPALAAK